MLKSTSPQLNRFLINYPIPAESYPYYEAYGILRDVKAT